MIGRKLFAVQNIQDYSISSPITPFQEEQIRLAKSAILHHMDCYFRCPTSTVLNKRAISAIEINAGISDPLVKQQLACPIDSAELSEIKASPDSKLNADQLSRFSKWVERFISEAAQDNLDKLNAGAVFTKTTQLKPEPDKEHNLEQEYIHLRDRKEPSLEALSAILDKMYESDSILKAAHQEALRKEREFVRFMANLLAHAELDE